MKSSNKFTVWTMWSIASIFYAYQYILRVMPNIMMNDIMEKFDIGPAIFGQFSGMYYIGYSLMHIPLGILLDKFGPRKILPIFMLFTVAGMLPLVVTDFWIYPIVGRLLVGMGSSSAILGVFKIVRMSFKEEHFARILSFSVTVGLCGAIFGGEPVNYMKSIFGFETVIWMLMAASMILSVVTYLVIPPHQEFVENRSVLQDIKTVITNRNVIAICLLAGMMVGPLEGFADVWGTSFLKSVYGFDDAVAASLPSLMFFGMMFGGPLLSLIAERTRNYLAVVLACAVLMGLGFATLLTGQLSTSIMSAMFFGIGILCGYQILAIYKASTYVPIENAGLTSAVANMIIMTFGYLFHAVIGEVISLYAEKMQCGALEAKALVYGLSVIPIGLFVSAIGLTVMVVKQQHYTRK